MQDANHPDLPTATAGPTEVQLALLGRAVARGYADELLRGHRAPLLAVNVREPARALGMSVSSAYDLVNRGELADRVAGGVRRARRGAGQGAARKPDRVAPRL